ncbi:MAG: hypothetical protein FJ265_20170 [Planctomycetes bacterium]|nr:hypothetical protein [Planctomycetota bacterium]
MRILFDQGVPVPLRGLLEGHAVETAFERSWSTRTNGELLHAAEAAGFEVLLTTDKRLRFQQSLAGRRLAVLILPTTRWPDIREHAGEVLAALARLTPGTLRELAW